MIYCVIPPELEGELYDTLTRYYEGNSDVTVIVDRRSGHDRRQGEELSEDERRTARDRRRARAAGTFPRIEAP